MAGFPTFKGSWPWPWTWIASYCIPSCITHRPVPTWQNSLKSRKLYVDGQTDGRKDGHSRPTLLGRLKSVYLTIKWQTTKPKQQPQSPQHRQHAYVPTAEGKGEKREGKQTEGDGWERVRTGRTKRKENMKEMEEKGKCKGRQEPKKPVCQIP